MDGKTIGAGVAAGLTLFLSGYLFYVLLLGGWFEGQLVSEASAKAAPMFAMIIGGEIILGILIARLFSVIGITNPADGAKHGFVLGLLIALGFGLIFAGAYNVFSLTGHLADAVVWGVRWALGGAVASWVLGRGSSD